MKKPDRGGVEAVPVGLLLDWGSCRASPDNSITWSRWLEVDRRRESQGGTMARLSLEKRR